MEVPVLKQGRYLIGTVQSGLTDVDLLRLRDSIVERIGRHRSRGVIVDVTALDVMDSFSCRTLSDIAQMIRLRGAELVIVGIQPEVAFTMVQLGLTLEGVTTALDLEGGLAILDRTTERHEKHHAQGAASRGVRVRWSLPRAVRPAGSLPA